MPSPYAGIEYLDPNRPGLQWLPQVAVSSATKLHHTASRTLLTQTFINPSTVSSIPTAQYTFPLYESCAIVAFRCYVGRRLIEGIIQEKDNASATFQAAVDRNEPASLLEQHTADVFTTSIGNVPPGETVKVEIEYIMELKHDAEIDGLRFTIPTSIAPRYGALPTRLSKHAASRAVTARNMNISVEVNMPGTIQSVESPSHTISLHLGAHSTNDPNDASNPHHALVTLSQTTTELGRDFILLIKCPSLSSPAALLEAHPTIPNSNALMVTLIPKFNLPRSTRPEVVFIVDRSGSMSSRMAPLKSSLSVFLKSVPLDVNFNICSFGSHHSFLWDRSRPYSNQTFAEAQEHCNRMQATFGGTEILPAIKSTIQRRLIGLNLEMMVLTDGEVWNSEGLFKYVEKETEKGDVRLFSLGIGRDVSHALVDGLARVGRGFSQVVSDEREGMESKVTRMLRGGLSAHIVNYRLEWEGKPSPEEVNLRSLSPVTSANHPSRISLFDSNANTDSPASFSDSPHFTIRTVIQAPHKIQPLFPFSRSTAYALISSDAQPPSHVFLRGTTPEGDELEVEIAVQRVPLQGETIHQLASRKILQGLRDGTSHVHGAIDKERQPALLAKWVEKEGVRVGLKYGVASHWTSFVAVERKEKVEVVKEEEMEVVEDEEEGRRDQRVVDASPPSVLDDDEDWVMEPERVNHDRTNDGMYRGGPPVAHFGQQFVGGRTSVPAMMLATLPPLPKPISTRNNHWADTRQKGRSTAPMSDYTDSIDDATFYSDQGSVPANLSPLIGNNNPTGKGTKGERVNKPAKRSLWSVLKRTIPLRIDRSSSSRSTPDRSPSPQSNALDLEDCCPRPSNDISPEPHTIGTINPYVPMCGVTDMESSDGISTLSSNHLYRSSALASAPPFGPASGDPRITSGVLNSGSWRRGRPIPQAIAAAAAPPAMASSLSGQPSYFTASENTGRMYSKARLIQPFGSTADYGPTPFSADSWGEESTPSPASPQTGITTSAAVSPHPITTSTSHSWVTESSALIPQAYKVSLSQQSQQSQQSLLASAGRRRVLSKHSYARSSRNLKSSADSALYTPAPHSDTPAGGDPGITSKNFSSDIWNWAPSPTAPPRATTTTAAAAVPPHPIVTFPSERPRSPESLAASTSKKLPQFSDTDLHERRFRLSSNKSSKKEKFTTSDIGILYSQSSPPPPERLFAVRRAQPMSSRTKTLIDLQTFEGCFVLDSALAALLGVSLSDLEARLISSVSATPGLGPEDRKTVWATILAIKLFETQLAGERSVWQLVVDKAKAWIARVGVDDIAQFEKMAGEVVLGA